MMGEQKSEPELFNYGVTLEKRVRSNHPLRKVKAVVDFGFVREEVAHCYGKKGNESVAPEVILKMMFLLFFDDIKSELLQHRVLHYGNPPNESNLNPTRTALGNTPYIFDIHLLRTEMRTG
jgi:hypothetical protein